MNRSEFIIAVAVILFVTFAFGWLARSLLSRFTRVSRKDVSDLDKMAEEQVVAPLRNWLRERGEA